MEKSSDRGTRNILGLQLCDDYTRVFTLIMYPAVYL